MKNKTVLTVWKVIRKRTLPKSKEKREEFGIFLSWEEAKGRAKSIMQEAHGPLHIFPNERGGWDYEEEWNTEKDSTEVVEVVL